MGEEHRDSKELELKRLLSDLAAKERRARNRSVLYIIVPILVGSLWLGLSLYKVQKLEESSFELQKQVNRLTERANGLEEKSKALSAEIKALTLTDKNVLENIKNIPQANRSRFLDANVNLDELIDQITILPLGERRRAVLLALVLASKVIPDGLDKDLYIIGFDSSQFIRFVLSQGGTNIDYQLNRHLSETMMQRFQRVESPMPGDLMFYRGDVGNFVMMYLGKGAPNGQGICVGTFKTGRDVRIMDSSSFDTSAYPFIGYYRVDYSS